jgi:hypothetical protein
MCPLAIATVLLCWPLNTTAEPTGSERLLATLIQRAELATTLGPSHPTRVRCEEAIRELHAAGVQVALVDVDRELERSIRRRAELRSRFGLSHPEVVKLHCRIAVLAGLLGGAADK